MLSFVRGPRLPLLFGLSSVLALSGCSLTASDSNLPQSVHVQGQVKGGNQLLGYSTMQLWAASSAGYGAASTPLTSNSLQADANGSFSLTGTYTCPNANSPVYLTASGGYPGTGGVLGGSANPNIVLMAALGSCGTLSSTTHITINEVTTIAAAYALAGFTTAYDHVGSSSTNLTGLTNAFGMAGVLASYDTGQSIHVGPTGSTVPTAEIYTMANALAACVNTTGGAAGDGSPCGKLFTYAMPSGGSAPTNTADAAINIAHAPGMNVSAIYNLVTSTGPFQPTLTSSPNDWTVAVKVATGGTAGVSAVAADVSGDVWVVDGTSVRELSPNGTVLGSNTAVSSGSSAAFDASGNLFVGAGTNIYKLTSLSSSTSFSSNTSPYSAGPLAVDATGNVWYTDGRYTLYKASNTGSVLGSYGPSGASHVDSVFPDTNNNLWVGDIVNAKVWAFTNAGSALSGSPFSCGSCSYAYQLAADASGNMWTAAGAMVTKVTPSGTYTNYGTMFSGIGGFSNVQSGFAVDGAGNIWGANWMGLSNQWDGSLSGMTSSGVALAPITGFTSSYTTKPYGLALDASGNAWLGSQTTPYLTVFIGAAVPVVTPVAYGLAHGTYGTKP